MIYDATVDDSNVDRYEGFVVKAVAPAGAAEVPPGTERRAAIFAGLAVVLLLAALDFTIVATALPTIVGELGGLTHLSWVVTAYLLAQTVATTQEWVSGVLHAPTPAGLEVLERLANARRAGLSELLADWSPEQHRDLSEFLRRVSANLSAEAPTR